MTKRENSRYDLIEKRTFDETQRETSNWACDHCGGVAILNGSIWVVQVLDGTTMELCDLCYTSLGLKAEIERGVRLDE
ncbi:hypothetical protein [endosymbiont DhMRE of Dentiscutata heterogama]|uniref:hypothetical protein n=1 Tax=endosymbiont DhMRE of Dentiscutata heterogama TaxID=1609546 RepID=UPI002AD44840|nr:hypothetical protein [endosymbiont DhMRE of Dentiscutata heterogama]